MPELKETRTVFADGKFIEYELVRKSVKNINLRITSDTKVHVSANRRVSLERIENFIKSKSDFINKVIPAKHLEQFVDYKKNEYKQYATSSDKSKFLDEKYFGRI